MQGRRWQALLPCCFKPGATRHQVLNTLDCPLAFCYSARISWRRITSALDYTSVLILTSGCELLLHWSVLLLFCPFDWAVVRQSQRLLQLLSQSHLSLMQRTIIVPELIVNHNNIKMRVRETIVRRISQTPVGAETGLEPVTSGL